MKNANDTKEEETLTAAVTVANSDSDAADDEVIMNNRRYKWYHVNLSMVPTKLAYFFECGRRIGYAPNLVLFLISIGLNKAESGFIVGLRSVG